jgi:hypothetical protein
MRRFALFADCAEYTEFQNLRETPCHSVVIKRLTISGVLQESPQQPHPQPDLGFFARKTSRTTVKTTAASTTKTAAMFAGFENTSI